jgi:hypothetical protein
MNPTSLKGLIDIRMSTKPSKVKNFKERKWAKKPGMRALFQLYFASPI